MITYLGCIADDFTGATDLAGLLARSGVAVSLRLGIPSSAEDTAPCEVIALKCRTAPVEEAVAAARAALAWLQLAGARQFFWKYCSTFDSTERGNIGPVAQALMADLRTTQTIYCPAFPENGRTVYMANLFVGDVPLAESPMRDHPLTPMRDSNLARLLAPQVVRPVGHIAWQTVTAGPSEMRARLDSLAADGVAHVVMDALTDADLNAIAAACADMPLLTGGSAVAAPLPAIHARHGLLAAEGAAYAPPDIGPGAVVLSGSCSAMTRAQVARFAEQSPSLRLDPLALADAGPEAALAWLASQDATATPMLYATAEPDAVHRAQEQLGPARAGEIVEVALAEIAVAARDAGRHRFVVAGGETSGAVAQALGIDRLDIGAEITPGVPWTFATSGGKRLALALKSGNFGGETFFADALAAL